MRKSQVMARSHGSGSACYFLRSRVKCKKCKKYRREIVRRERRTPGTYNYLVIHGLGKPGEVERQLRNRLAKTPGTYKYRVNHGLGKPGEARRRTEARQRETPGTYKYQRDHSIGRPGLVHRLGEVKRRIPAKEKRLVEIIQVL